MPMRWSRTLPGPKAVMGRSLLNRPARLHAALATSTDPDNDMLDAVEAGPADRVMVVGGTTADLLCASIRRGCRGAVGLATAPAHPDPADVVLAPRVSTAEEALGIARSALRALRGSARHGRLVVRLIGQGAQVRARELALALAALGFARIQIGRRAGGVLVTGECRRAGLAG